MHKSQVICRRIDQLRKYVAREDSCGFTAVLLSCSSELPGHTQRTAYIFDDIRLFSAIIAAWRQLEVKSRVDKVLTTQTEQTVKC